MGLLDRILPVEMRRRRALRAARGPLRDYLAVPFPRRNADAARVRFLAVDLETTGLDPGRDAIVSAGWVKLDATSIDLSTARHRLVATARPMPEESAILHRIGDDAAARGDPPEVVLAELLDALRGRVLVAHNAPFELAMLGAACARLFGARFVAPAVDTMSLARSWVESHGATHAASSLRLDAVRRRHNLPRYRAHDALSDALAAAELFLAQLAERERANGRGIPLRSVLAGW
jgi:DNA polymerase-3 subunit epsilon